MGKVLIVRVKEGGAKGRGCYEYKNEINGEDFKQIAVVFLDLDSYGLKIDKAIQEYKKLKGGGEFPF